MKKNSLKNNRENEPGAGQEDIYVLNPGYLLKPDKNRILILDKGTDPVIDSFIGFVHPVYAIILSLFDGEKNLSQVMSLASSLLKKDKAIVSNIIMPLLENEEDLHFHYDGFHFSFPGRLLIKKDDSYVHEAYNIKSFFIPKKDLDMESWRLDSPLDALFMINTRCATDCVYCYADRTRNMDCTIPIDRLKVLIREARELGMRSFDITGGELFLYKHWEILLPELLANGFNPYVSTKCPIDEDTIKQLKQMGLKRIQVSIDSIISDELTRMLGVPADYLTGLLETLKNFDAHGFEIYTNTQITSFNQDNTGQLLEYLLNLKNIKRINMGAAGYSLYRGQVEYLKYRPRLEAIEEIKKRMDGLKEQYQGRIAVNFSGYTAKSDLLDKSPDEKKKSYDERARCSANFYAFVVLPDGKVTICEELYWHPVFIIGDLCRQSIAEAWNSKRALELYNLTKDMIREESQCKTCGDFESCHKYKGVCWKEVLYAYGDENWDYPDPKCQYAKKPLREYYL